METSVEIFIKILDLAIVVSHIGAGDSNPDKLCRDLSLQLLTNQNYAI